MASEISADQMRFFEEHGYLIMRDVLESSEVEELKQWAQEVHDWEPQPDSPFMPYEEINDKGRRVLCRTENYANYHAGFNKLLRGSRLTSILSTLSGDDMVLFKEKINYKLAGSGGFAPHIDANAYTHIKDVKHLTILLAVDTTDMTNGGLEVVDGSHKMNCPIAADNCLEPGWIKAQTWTPVELEPGQLLVFGSYLAHRSGANTSTKDRKAIYATYNRLSEGDLHDQYYARRTKEWPATHMRVQGEDYTEGSHRYAFGSPMLSIDMGKQYQV